MSCTENILARRLQRSHLYALPPPRNYTTENAYDVVVAIDFGTSFSGFAFSFNHRDGSEDIFMNRAWGSAQGYSTFKTPTCLLLSPLKEFDKFGFEAAEKYAELEDANEKSFYCFDRFKMKLHGSEVSDFILPNWCFKFSNRSRIISGS